MAKRRRHMGWRDADITGVRSPPLRGVDNPSWDGLAVEGQGMTRKAIFSEGRGLRARVARPYSCQGISLPEVSGRGLMETCLGQAQAFFNGRAEPAPPRGASLAERPWEENPGIMWRAVFSEGRGFCARVARPYSCQGISLPEVSGRVAVA